MIPSEDGYWWARFGESSSSWQPVEVVDGGHGFWVIGSDIYFTDEERAGILEWGPKLDIRPEARHPA